MSQFLRGLVAVFVALFVAACNTPSPSPVDELTPVATTTVTDTQGVISRFTNAIWPAISAYNSDISQGSPGNHQYLKIIAPELKRDEAQVDQYGNLRSAVQKLGTVQEGSQTQPHIMRDGAGLHLVDTALTALDSSKATLQVCYTFTADTRRTINDPTDTKPFASEATVELRKTDNWYLYALSDDHVVAGCSASSKA